MSARYVYAIVGSDHPGVPDGVTGVGAPAVTPRLLAGERTAAVVSDAPPGLRAKRRDLLGHQRVVDALHARGPVLPMRFGIVAESEESLLAELAEATDRHITALATVRDRVEFNTKLMPNEDALVRQVAEDDPVIRRLRRPQGSHTDQLRLGEAVAAAVQRHQDADRDTVLRALTPLTVTGTAGPPVQGCALNASFLVDNSRVAAFRSGVEQINHALAIRGELRCIGPLPPYSFTTVAAR